MDSHVLLAACQPSEKAEEDNGNDKIRGVFTINMLDYLRKNCKDGKLPDQLTYARLVGCVVRSSDSKVKFTKNQNPLCQGKHRDRLLFKTSEYPEEADSFAVMRDGSSTVVLACDIHGVVKDTRFIMRDPAGATRDTADGIPLRAVTVEALRCTVEPADGTDIPWDSPTSSALVDIETWNSKPMKLHTTLAIPPLQGPVRWVSVKGEKESDVSIKVESKVGSEVESEVDSSRWIISLFDPLTAQYRGQSVARPCRRL